MVERSLPSHLLGMGGSEMAAGGRVTCDVQWSSATYDQRPDQRGIGPYLVLPRPTWPSRPKYRIDGACRFNVA